MIERELLDLTRLARRWEIPSSEGLGGLLVSVTARHLLGPAVGEFNRSGATGTGGAHVLIGESHAGAELYAHIGSAKVPLDPLESLTSRELDLETPGLYAFKLTLHGFFGSTLVRWNFLVGDEMVSSLPVNQLEAEVAARFVVGSLTLSYANFMRARAGLMDWREAILDGRAIEAQLAELIGALGSAYRLPSLGSKYANLIADSAELVSEGTLQTPLPATDYDELLEQWPDLGGRWRVNVVSLGRDHEPLAAVELWPRDSENSAPAIFTASDWESAVRAASGATRLEVRVVSLGGGETTLLDATDTASIDLLTLRETVRRSL